MSDDAGPAISFAEFIGKHPTLNEAFKYVGWSPGDREVCLDGYYTAAELRSIAEFIEQHQSNNPSNEGTKP